MGDSDASEDYDHLYKIILLGNATVGKSHLLSRYVRGRLPKTPKSTVGVEFATRTVPVAWGGTVKAQIWDTAGQERYRSITAAHYRRAVGALLVYDVTKKQSFLAASRWLEDLRQTADPDVVVMLVGNKVDLVERSPALREVPKQAGAAFAEANGLLFGESSAVSGYNVKQIFEELLQEIYNQQQQQIASDEQNGFARATQGGDAYTQNSIFQPSGGISLGDTRYEPSRQSRQVVCCQM